VILRTINHFKILDAAKDKRNVDLLKFILYLFIQRANVISLTSAVVTGDEFPSRHKSQDLEGRAGIGSKVKNDFFTTFTSYCFMLK